MTAPNLIAIVGTGSALTLAGFGLIGGAAGVGLYYFFPQIHLGVWLLIIGVAMLLLGLTLVERGGAKTVEKVENELSMPNVMSNFPWTFVGLGAGAAIFLYWLLRRPAPQEVRTEIKPVYVPGPPPAGSMNSGSYFSQPQAPKRITLSDVLIPLGSAAASYATSVGMKALGVPSPKDILSSVMHKFMGGVSQEGRGSSTDGSRPVKSHNGYESAMRRS